MTAHQPPGRLISTATETHTPYLTHTPTTPHTPRTHRRRQARLHLQELRLACPFGQSVQVGLQAQPRTPPSAHTNPKATLPRQLPCLTPTAALSHSPASPPLPRSRFPPHPSDHKVTGLPHQAKGLGHGWVLEQWGHRGRGSHVQGITATATAHPDSHHRHSEWSCPETQWKVAALVHPW